MCMFKKLAGTISDKLSAPQFDSTIAQMRNSYLKMPFGTLNDICLLPFKESASVLTDLIHGTSEKILPKKIVLSIVNSNVVNGLKYMSIF